VNLANIPAELHHLFPLISKWGIGDDGERDSLVYGSSISELEELVESLSGNDADMLNDWLAGPEAAGPEFTAEYLALSSYFMACEYARAILRDTPGKIKKAAKPCIWLP
jgi:hypothetical protein